jgi:GrpB-like predicted nucleotidyltransferase (UPF0157 family)
MAIRSDAGLSRAILEGVALEASDPAWPVQFGSERQRLLDALPGRFIGIEHFGSTAVPGLIAKPVIDILAGLESLVEVESLIDRLGVLGYHYPAEFNSTLSDRHWLMRQHRGRRTHHLHLVVFGSSAWLRELAFRDLLRANPEIASQYAVLKAELADMYRNDRESYTQAKGEFIANVLRTAG